MTAWTARTGCNKNNFCNFDLESSTACSNCTTFYQNENRQWHENETLASQQRHPVTRLLQQVLMWRHWFLTSEWNDTLKDAFPLSLQLHHHFVSARMLALQLKPNPWWLLLLFYKEVLLHFIMGYILLSESSAQYYDESFLFVHANTNWLDEKPKQYPWHLSFNEQAWFVSLHTTASISVTKSDPVQLF